METLFDVAPAAVNGEFRSARGGCSTAQLGRATELRVQALLLERGLVPSEPLTDEVGCDLLVGRFAVQVKSARANVQRGGCGSRQYVFSSQRGWRADVYVFRAVEDDLWWVVPHAELMPYVSPAGAVCFSPAPRQYGQRGRPNRTQELNRFRDAWHVFDG